MFLVYWGAKLGLAPAVLSRREQSPPSACEQHFCYWSPGNLNHLFRNSMLLARVQPGVHHEPQALYCKAAFHLGDKKHILQEHKYFLSKKTWLAYIVSGENANSPLLSALHDSALLERKPCRCLWQQGRVPRRAVSGLCAIHFHENSNNKNFSCWLIVTALSYWVRVFPGLFFSQ